MSAIKHIPNLISVLRILGSLALLAVEPFGLWFFVIYALCGVSDLLDGWIARKFDLVSQTGQVLDSVADFILITVLLFLAFGHLTLPTWCILWVFGISILRFISLAIGWIKYHRLSFLHTYGNKLTGFLLFCFPLFYLWLGFYPTIALLCLAATLSAAEEVLLQLLSKTLDRDVKSLF